MNRIQFRVEGLNNQQTANTIQEDIGGFTGVNQIEISVADQTITVSHDPTLITEMKLKEAIEMHGFVTKSE